jgi:membrane fusion protein, copper/silver efflux system
MKRNILVGLFLLLVGILQVSCKDTINDKHADAGTFTCPMHPQIMNSAPGTCPICGMDLVPVNASGGKNELMLSDSQIQLANVRTMPISSSSFSTSKVLNGRLIVNPKRTSTISSRYSGRVERLYIRETGIMIKKGQALFQIYSEVLQTLQEDYLLQLKQVAAFPNEKIYSTMRDAAKNKLRLFGMSETQIKSIDSGSKVSPLLTVFSSESGTITEMNITEGQYVAEGTQLLKLENFDQLWLEMDVYPSEVADLKIGTKIKAMINGIGNDEQTLTIDFISPQIDPSSQILTARASIKNSGNLQAGMQASVFLPVSEINDAMSLPLDAVVRDERGTHIWVKVGKNTFAPRIVQTGAESENQIIILSGLDGVKEVVISGAYLLSSEFLLKKGVDPMLKN